jgi:hypothetical protein
VIFNLFMITCSRFLDIFYPLSHLVGNWKFCRTVIEVTINLIVS